MDDHDERDSRTTILAARVRNALDGVRQQGAASLRGVRRSAAGATDRLKSTQAAERLGAAVETRRVIKKATEAQRRGNHPMAFRLLEPEVRENPDDARLVAAFWNAALACERVEDAVPALLRIIRKLASTGEPERAAELWLELRDAAPSALVDPSSLVRMVPALEADGRSEQVVLALREAVDPRNDSDLSPGLAGRVAEMAHQLDPPTALTAARRALTSLDLHETKRARLEGLVAELEKARAGAAAEAPAETPAEALAAPAEQPAEAPAAPAEELAETPAAPAEELAEAPAAPVATTAPAEVTKRAVDDALEALAPTARFSDIKVMEAMPTRLREEAPGRSGRAAAAGRPQSRNRLRQDRGRGRGGGARPGGSPGRGDRPGAQLGRSGGFDPARRAASQRRLRPADGDRGTDGPGRGPTPSRSRIRTARPARTCARSTTSRPTSARFSASSPEGAGVSRRLQARRTQRR
jgi:hypothetical protein